MAWQNIDWIKLEVGEYETDLNDLVREPYRAARSTLEKTFHARRAVYEQALGKAPSEADALAAQDHLMYAEWRWDEQGQALASMALSILVTLNKEFLDGMKNLFKRAHPADPKGYAAKSTLDRQAAEFRSRFGVDIEAIKTFQTVREIELARNSSLHNESKPTEDYRKKTACRLIGKSGNIDFTPEILDVLILELSEFGRELSVAMKKIVHRDEQTSKKKGPTASSKGWQSG